MNFRVPIELHRKKILPTTLQNEGKKQLWHLPLPSSCIRIQGVFVVLGQWGDAHVVVLSKRTFPLRTDDPLLSTIGLEGNLSQRSEYWLLESSTFL